MITTRTVVALSILLVLLTAGLVLPPHPAGSHTGHTGIGGVARHAAVTLSTRMEPEQHALHADAALLATASVGAGLLAWAWSVRRSALRPSALPAHRGRGPPGTS
ncbi:MAG TPA: hypothetical protein VMB79_18870 [Jatrophihabitans sp.]|nr:hypothetical protein [Jatrophihabitans sp.]